MASTSSGRADGDGMVSYAIEVDDENNVLSVENEVSMLVDSIYTNEEDDLPVVRQPLDDNLDSADIAEAERVNELTQLYLTGSLTFSEFVRGIDGDGDELRNSDSDFEPSPQLKRTGRSSKISEAFCKEFDASTSKRRKSSVTKIRRVLPPVLSNLLGEANLKYATNEKDLAAQICEEIIRQVPQAPGPFKLLALVHRDKGDTALAHHYSLIAAHLSPNSCDDWIHLAETSLELGEKDQALTCLNQAIKSDRYNPDPRLRQIKLLQTMGESKAAQRARESMVQTLCSSILMTHRHGRLILLQAKIAAREFHQENNLPRATRIMETAITACKTSAVQDDIHLLVELHCEQNENLKGLKILVEECGVVLEPKEPPFKLCHCPDTLATDLQAKLVVFLVRLDIDPSILIVLLKPFLESNPDDEGDLFLDIVEALMAKSRYEEAIILLQPLITSEAFSRAAVWLTHGECLRNLNNTEEAVASYRQVMQLAPQHVQARLTLSSLLCQLGKYAEALEVLRSKDPEPRLLFEEFHLLCQSQETHHTAVDVALTLMSQYIKLGKLREMYLNFIQRRRSVITEVFVENGPTEDDLLGVLNKAADICFAEKLYSKFKKLTFICLFVKPLQEFRRTVEYLCLMASIFDKDASIGWLLLKSFIVQHESSNNIWNLFGLSVKYPEDTKHTRFITRLISRNPSNWPAGICYSNNCFMAGAYKDALIEYGTRHKVSPAPYTALMIGLCWVHIVCQKRVSDRNVCVLQAKAFLEEYASLRGKKCKQEIYYNLGRAMHQLSLMELAQSYYLKALNCPPPSELKNLDLTKEVAYNLAFLYKSSGNILLANKIINQYIVI